MKKISKEVCKVKGVQSKDVLQENDKNLLQNLYQNRAGLLVKTLSKLTNLKTRVIYKRLNILKEKKIVEHISPIWKIVNGQFNFVHSLLKDDNIFELHNLSGVLKLIKVPDWWENRKPRLEKIKGWQFKQINFGKGDSNPFQQMTNENFVIQTYPESIIIILRKRYYSNNPYTTIVEGLNDILDIISYFEERCKFKFFPNGIPALEIRNEDFNRMKDHLALHCKKEGRRFLVETSKGKVWVDYSEPFGKEANTPDIQDTLEKHTKDLIMNKPMLNSELQNLVQKIAQVQLIEQQNKAEYSKDLVAHKEAIKQMGNSTEANTKSIELLAEVIKKLIEDRRI
jgi:hypothetical protein